MPILQAMEGRIERVISDIHTGLKSRISIIECNMSTLLVEKLAK